MRNMDIKLRPIESEEFDSLFSVVKQGIYSHVDAVFGWDDDFQRNRLK
ncbi:GNAT family N-acetyltransferase, partial [Vibrio cholerae]|nr:GNAT family N-acetyltransferase [Vibrio cholerae]NOE51391.1 GNAT family N-acetyltransferase [Vibrio cholerae]